MWNLLRSRDDPNLVQCSNLGTQATMHAQDFPVDDGGEGEEVEDLTAGFPNGGVAVFLLAFFVEAVDLGDLAGFMVAADEGDFVWISADHIVSMPACR